MLSAYVWFVVPIIFRQCRINFSTKFLVNRGLFLKSFVLTFHAQISAYACLVNETHCFSQIWVYISKSELCFTFMHLAEAFIQSDLHCIQVTVFTFYQLLLSLGIEPMILALLAPCSTIWATGKLFFTILTWYFTIQNFLLRITSLLRLLLWVNALQILTFFLARYKLSIARKK